MITAIIIDDEPNNIDNLKSLLDQHCPQVEVKGTAKNADEGALLINRLQPDLVLLDIQMPDKNGFEMLQSLSSYDFEVIFVTAYDQYGMQAVKFSAIDYLLKPIDQTELRQAFEKFTRTTGAGSLQEKINRLLDNIPIAKAWKKRLVVKTHDGFESLHTEDITFFRAQDKQVFVQTIDGKEHLTDESLDELEKLLDPAHFFRLNRQYISSADSIEKIENHFNGKLKVQLRRCGDEDIYVSREKVPAFKLWLGA